MDRRSRATIDIIPERLRLHFRNFPHLPTRLDQRAPSDFGEDHRAQKSPTPGSA
jgi:hypothetical protein